MHTTAGGETLTNYIFHNYGHLLAPVESLALRSLYGDAKASASSGKMADFLRKHFVSNEAEVKHLPADGARAFRARMRDRILAEHKDEVVLNRCASCGSLARTPLACLCPACNHTWYELRKK
jgi:hypothetical protein